MSDTVDVSPLARIMIEAVREGRREKGVFVLQDDADIIDLALLNVLTCGVPNFQPGAGLALTAATGAHFNGNHSHLVDVLQKGITASRSKIVLNDDGE
ncbi:hypothetical protein KAR91_40355 [Candidatus Pacearchaeota archaeon]|nr:hypothetical protein [Candidatus Pacearchaeota archaeon]